MGKSPTLFFTPTCFGQAGRGPGPDVSGFLMKKRRQGRAKCWQCRNASPMTKNASQMTKNAAQMTKQNASKNGQQVTHQSMKCGIRKEVVNDDCRKFLHSEGIDRD